MPLSPEDLEYEFWRIEGYGLVRQRRTATLLYDPEVWRSRRWHTGSRYVLDAIAGMGEDVWSGVDYAEKCSLEDAKKFAAKLRIDLFAENPDDPYPPADE